MDEDYEMKIICLTCGISGVLQQRGNSCRVQHYIGSRDGKRVYFYHKVGAKEITDGSNGSKFTEAKRQVVASLVKIWSLGRDSDPRPPPYQGGAPPG